MRVLVVSSFPFITRLLKSMLADLGLHEVDAASDSQAALAKIDSGSIELVLCDWTLEPEFGLDVLAKVRADAARADLAFVLMFAESSGEKIERLRLLGASGYLVKPFDIAALQSVIARVRASASP